MSNILKNEEKQILRFTTAGSVDDGKSTLIGRLLYDSKSIYTDQIENLQKISEKKGISHLELAHLTDGLKDEREQGITIDVAYRYFSTPKRKFIVADTPGHIQYTRNMITGASTANLALILVDARKGVIEQTKRHSFIASLLQLQHVVVCVNKMDLINYSEEEYDKIVEDYKSFASKLQINDIRFIPISALNGDNVVNKSENMDWYKGDTLLGTLETIHISSDYNMVDCRFPVQTVIRPFSDEHHDYRGYAGRIVSGIFKKGDEVMVLPSGYKSKIQSIVLGEETLDEAFPPQSVTINLEDDIDVSRGDMIVREHNQPEQKQDIEVMLCWLNNEKFQPRAKYTVKHTTVDARAIIKEILYKVDINTLHRQEDVSDVEMNDIIRVKIRTTKPLLVDEYNQNRGTGSLILIDESTNETVAAGMII
ncbi:sulfate adenylyltransferase subunit CysN [Leeuwenhoekiella sp. A16]|uniref:sulfate adenylyltransferase subunit CysN n=1 Tax=unclassified Leeuwenhoekiella TaxID=2615029 RepID=UPI003A7FB4F7|tara:strand:- start:102864 stop:104132 length:1269 start_codon:yes stop_codon:yes gene_type:complete